jgi:hypothetical protein
MSVATETPSLEKKLSDGLATLKLALPKDAQAK